MHCTANRRALDESDKTFQEYTKYVEDSKAIQFSSSFALKGIQGRFSVSVNF